MLDAYETTMTSRTELKVALVGSGSMGLNHARVIATNVRTILSVVIDPDEVAGRKAADLYGSRWAPDLSALEGMDAAVLAAPTEFHFELAMPIIEAGIPLLIEKPVCPSLAQTEQIVNASAARGQVLMCGLLERFNPAFVVARQMIDDPVYVRAERHSPYAPRVRTGVAWDLLVHDVDLVVQVFGGDHPTSVDVSIGQFDGRSVPGAEDVVEATLRFGANIASVSASRMSQRKVRTLLIHDIERMLEVDLLRRTVTAYRHATIESDEGRSGFRQVTEIEVPEIIGAEPLVSQLFHFVDLIEGREDVNHERRAIMPAHTVVDQVLSSH